MGAQELKELGCVGGSREVGEGWCGAGTDVREGWHLEEPGVWVRTESGVSWHFPFLRPPAATCASSDGFAQTGKEQLVPEPASPASLKGRPRQLPHHQGGV